MFGALLMAAGVLVATLSGMCAISVLATGGHGLMQPLVSLLVGLGMTFLGWAVSRA